MYNQNITTIFLDEYGRYPLVIPKQVLEELTAIVMKTRVCHECTQRYTHDNPMVVQNTCLRCFLASPAARREKNLRFIGEHGRDDDTSKYAFIDKDGYVFIVNTSRPYNTLDADKYQTLVHWGYILPETLDHDVETVQFNTSDWYIYGDFRQNQVIVVRYREDHRPYTNMLFFAYNGDVCTVINKRRNPVWQWLKDAKAQLEATKDREGKYHLYGGGTTYNLDEDDCWPLVAEYANKQYVLKQAQGGQHV